MKFHLSLPILTILTIPFISYAYERPEKVTEQQIKNIETSLMDFKLIYGRIPTTREGLEILVDPPPHPKLRDRGSFLKRVPLDPWGMPFHYYHPAQFNKNSFDIISSGRNKVFEGGLCDDIRNWENPEQEELSWEEKSQNCPIYIHDFGSLMEWLLKPIQP